MALSASVTVCGALASGAAAELKLPDGRAYEQVSPVQKDGALLFPQGFGTEGLLGGIIEASETGSSITYVASAPTEPNPEGNRAIEGLQVLSHISRCVPPGPPGCSVGPWLSRDIITPHTKAEGFSAGAPQEYRLFSEDLSRAIVMPFILTPGNKLQEPPLVPGVAEEEASVYRRNTSACEAGPTGCYEPLVNTSNRQTQEPFGGHLELEGASPDLQHVVVESTVPLTPFAAEHAGEEPQLYEVNTEKPTGEQIQEVSILPPPSGAPAIDPHLGAIGPTTLGFESVGRNDRGAVSLDGTRVFWSGTEEQESKEGEALPFHHLYLRDMANGQTLKIDEPQEGLKEPISKCRSETSCQKASEAVNPTFQFASKDGSRVFFTDNVPLTLDAKTKTTEAGAPPDLYVCEIKRTPEGKDTCTLKDLTASLGSSTVGAAVIGRVIGASETGTIVYYVANGAPEGTTRGKCSGVFEAAKGTCYLYDSRYNETTGTWGLPQQIAVLAGRDDPDWAGEKIFSQLSARVSTNGNFLVFMSERELVPGENNVDASPKARGAHDEEVFQFDAAAAPEGTPGSAGVTCVSCNPNHERPTGIYDPLPPQELLVDPSGRVWGGHWLAATVPPTSSLDSQISPYQSRYALNDGRVYFQSADHLVPEATATRSERVPGKEAGTEELAEGLGVMDVYQYEPKGAGSCGLEGGCVSLLSSGSDPHESAFLDASASGEDVFLLSSVQLAPTDLDSSYDVYDAHVCTAASPCVPPPPPVPPSCASEASCRTSFGGVPTFAPGGTATFSGPQQGPGPLPKSEVLPEKAVEKPKPKETKAQKLRKALSACRKKYRHNKHKRAACERNARKRYGPHKKKGHK